MVSYSGYWQYQNLIQADPIPKKEKCYIPENSISGYLQTHPEFKLFQWMIKLAEMELKMGNEQFDSTLFVVPDSYLIRQFGSEQYFINMDKHRAIHIINAHLLNRKIHKKTLESQRLTKIYTKNQSTEIYFLNNYGEITINNMAKIIKEDIRLDNGVIHIIDNLLLPVF
jgi:uncharacterized surface protein with fasciclin (FAS1) repeats